MKKASIYLLGLLLIFNFTGFQNSLLAQDKNPCEEWAYTEGLELVKIEDIVDSKGKPYNEEKVTVVGVVKRFVQESSDSKAYYELEGKFGDIIRVSSNADEEPKKLVYYIVEGTVYIKEAIEENEPGIPFIHEEWREECAEKINVITTDPVAAEEVAEPEKTWLEENLIIVLAGLGVIILIVIVVIVIVGQSKKKENVEADRQRQYEADLAKKSAIQKETAQSSQPKPKVDDDQDFKTIKIFIDDPKTMKFIPGKLEIISGDDKGKTFLISGYPTPEGSIVTIGRDNVTGDRKFAHIQLDKRFQTVGRKQAELIYKSGKLYARNVGETNPTQVDGNELQVGQMAEVSPGSVIRTGELEFKYVV